MKGALSLASRFALCTACACSPQVTLDFFEQETEPVGNVGEGGAGSESCQELGPEVCNGADDDCDGEIDEGCAHTIAWRPQDDGDSLGHPAEGATFSEVCPTGTILTGMRVAFGEALNQVAAICSQVGVSAKGTKATTTFSATLGPRLSRSLIPAVSEDPANLVADLSCPDDHVASMLEGDDDLARHILDVRIRCAPLIVTEQTGGAVLLDLDLSQEKALAPLACSSCTAPEVYGFASSVPPGQIARRLFGGVGALINRVGFGTNVARIAIR